LSACLPFDPGAMMTKAFFLLGIVALCVSSVGAQVPSPQRASPSVSFEALRLGAVRAAPATIPVRDTLLGAGDHATNSRHLWKYLLTGGVIGGAIGTGALALSVRNSKSDDAMIPISGFIAAAGGVGALLGGLLGYAAYADPYPNPPAK
jgi:hypothetical protein